MGWFFAAVLLGVLLLGLLLTHRLRRSRRPDEPPLDKGLIPWLGHALEFGQDAASFLSDMQKKHGDIFTIQAAGKFVTVLLDPRSYDAVLWESSSKLDFGQYARILMDRMFDVQLPDYDPKKEKAMLKTTLQNKNLTTLTQAVSFNLRTILLDSSKVHGQWEEEGLFHLSYSTMLRAGYLTLYGNESKNYEDVSSQAKDRAHSLEVYQRFYELDRLLMKAARSNLTTAERKKITICKQDLWKILSVEKLNSRANRSVWLDSYKQHLVDLGLDEDMQTKAMVLQLWSTQNNAGPAVFWLLLFLLKYPSAMAAVQGEMEKILKSKNRATGKVDWISQEILDGMHIFDSALKETLRMTAAPFISREVLQDMSLKLADGREYHLRKGDRLCLFPFISPQMDPEIYEEPEVFKYDRFLNSDGTEKTDFYKGGQKLKYYTMPWGGGLNVCIGKDFAINSIKLCVFLLLSSLDLELKDPKAEIPGFDKERYGFGMLQPDKEVIVRYKRKDQ
ncbi:Prostacyclin synthase [Varanus komodoensis]|uniref:Prostacyclin synthase n=1 Tax=Varanus komodoensis TaxID=61221 RepID=A0A8D2IU27_VARKO|nr:prostacyclin synthase [Varanus komodoensis]KAF7240858.1 Prostacyclin synthase [Varanus komodoensis]